MGELDASYVAVMQDSCTSCPHADGSLNQNCTGGHYSIGRSVACVSCPPGYYCPHINLAEVLACDLGTYSVGGQA